MECISKVGKICSHKILLLTAFRQALYTTENAPWPMTACVSGRMSTMVMLNEQDGMKKRLVISQPQYFEYIFHGLNKLILPFL